MIDYIIIRNFQSHVNTRVDFSPKLTAITGESMSGKTAIKRALELVRTNRPLGFRYNYRYAEGPTIVEIGVDGHIVRFAKSTNPIDDEGNKAAYHIEYPDGRTEYFTAFGTSVPSEVSELLGISDISIQDQLDAYLLVISSSGEIAKTINRITGIDIGDNWLKEINKTATVVEKEKDKLSGEVEFLTQEVQKYEGVDDLDATVQTAKLLDAEYQDLIRKNNDIVDIINKHTAAKQWLKETKENLSPLESILKEFEDADSALSALKKKREDILNAMLIGEELNEIKSVIEFLSPELERLEEIAALEERREGINSFINKYLESREQCRLTAVEITRQKKNLEMELLRLGVCNFCGSKIDDRKVIQILERT